MAGSGLTSADYQGRAITEPSFNSGIVWHATDQDTPRLTAARGLQLPSLFDLGYQSTSNIDVGPIKIPVYYLGSPKLRASAVSNLELGYDRALPILNSSVRVFGVRAADGRRHHRPVRFHTVFRRARRPVGGVKYRP